MFAGCVLIWSTATTLCTAQLHRYCLQADITSSSLAPAIIENYTYVDAEKFTFHDDMDFVQQVHRNTLSFNNIDCNAVHENTWRNWLEHKDIVRGNMDCAPSTKDERIHLLAYFEAGKVYIFGE